jgi:hypothetical protein
MDLIGCFLEAKHPHVWNLHGVNALAEKLRFGRVGDEMQEPTGDLAALDL